MIIGWLSHVIIRSTSTTHADVVSRLTVSVNRGSRESESSKRSAGCRSKSWAGGVIEKCEPVGKLEGNQIGAKRLLNGAFHETLLAVSDVDRSVKYSHYARVEDPSRGR